MKPVLVATIFLAVAAAVSGREIPTDVGSRIAGGSIAEIGQFPYQVSLRVYFRHFCGGSILNNRWILTAAHCILTKRPDEISVIAGTNFLSEAGQMYQAIYKITHPQYNSITLKNDIGLLLVSRVIEFTDRIQPVVLPTSNFDQVNYPATLTGWGAITTDGEYFNNLKYLQVNVIAQKDCKAKNSKVTDENLCTLKKVGEGACLGDGGGPLIADGVQIGIFSFLINSCASGQPDVYTRVWSFTKWIESSIKSYNGIDYVPQ